MGFEAYSQEKSALINDYIEKSLARCREQTSRRFSPLIEAMAYSLEGRGKRLRPLLVLATGEYVGVAEEKLLPAACALEYIHTYSLIHDDLPAIDDDDERRGKPSSHKKFGEAIAILAGDALLTEAFGQMRHLVEESGFDALKVMEATQLLVNRAGVGGMVGGQLLDVTTDHETLTLPELEFIHIHKTGALIMASVLVPAILAGSEKAEMNRLRKYSESLGLAFQISDDLLDVNDSIRYARQPRKKPKPSYHQIMSATEIRERLNGLTNEALNSVADSGHSSGPLMEIAEFVRTRTH